MAKRQQRPKTRQYPNAEISDATFPSDDSEAGKILAAIRKNLQARNPNFLFNVASTEKSRAARASALFFLWMGIAFHLSSFHLYLVSGSLATRTFVMNSAMVVFGFCMLKTIDTAVSPAPKKLSDVDLWRLRQGRRYLTWFAVAVMCTVIGIGTLSPSSAAWLFFAGLGYVGYIGLVIWVTGHPELFPLLWIQVLSNLLYSLFSTFLTIGGVSIIFGPQSMMNTSRVVIIYSTVSLIAFPLLRTLQKGMSPLQNEVLNYAIPDQIFHVMRPLELQLQHELEALVAFQKLEKEYSYGVKREIARQITRKYESKRSGLLIILSALTAVLCSLLVLIYTSFGQFLLYDLIYEPYIQPLLCNLKMMKC